jgi:hypothetical protein
MAIVALLNSRSDVAEGSARHAQAHQDFLELNLRYLPINLLLKPVVTTLFLGH